MIPPISAALMGINFALSIISIVIAIVTNKSINNIAAVIIMVVLSMFYCLVGFFRFHGLRYDVLSNPMHHLPLGVSMPRQSSI